MKPPREQDSSSVESPFSTPQKHSSSQLRGLKQEQERDITIFRSFCALKLVMDALWAAVQIGSGLYPTSSGGVKRENRKERKRERAVEEGKEEEKEKEGREREGGGEDETRRGIEAEKTETNPGGGKGSEDIATTAEKETTAVPKMPAGAARQLNFGEEGNRGPLSASDDTVEWVGGDDDLGLAPRMQDQLYSKLVLGKFQEAKVYISLLYPLTYRLEILENIFSLVFLTSKDIRPLRHAEGARLLSMRSRVSVSSPKLESTTGRTPPVFQSDNEFSALLPALALIGSKQGFLNDEKVTSDLLSFLQDSMFELRAARYVLTQGAETGSPTTLPPDGIHSSITQSALQQRMAKLEQYINEARWRLQLVSAKHGISAGYREEGGKGSHEDREQWVGIGGGSSDRESVADVSGSDSELEEKVERVKKPQRKAPSIDSQESKPDTQHLLPTAAVFETTPPPSNGRSHSSMPRVAYNGKVSPGLVQASSTTNMAASQKPLLPLSHSLTAYGMSSPRVSLSPKLQNRRSLRQKSPRESVGEGGRSGSRPGSSSPIPPTVEQLRGEEDSGDFADVDEYSPSNPNRSKKRKKRRNWSAQTAKKRRRNASERGEYGVAHSSVVSEMLASPGSLLRMCLRHSNYLRAYEVLKMFNMEGEFGEAIVQFTEKFESVSRNLAVRSRGPTPKHSPSLTPGETPAQQKKSSTLKGHSSSLLASVGRSVPSYSSSSSSASSSFIDTHLQVAIAHATSSSTTLESLHHLLAPSSIHRMLFSGDEHLERIAHNSGLLQTLVKHVPTLVMLDVVCSNSLDGHISKRIIELATCRCQAALEALHTQSWSPAGRKPPAGKRWAQTHQDIHLPGPLSLLLLLSEVSGYFTCPTLPRLPHSSLPTSSSSYHSPHALFSSFPRQLRTSSIMHQKSFLDSYRSSREALEQILGEGRGEEVKGDIVTALSSPGTALEESAHSVSLSHPRRLVSSIFEELLQVLTQNPRGPSMPGSPKERGLVKSPPHSPGGSTDTAYVLRFSHYLTRLMDLLLKCLAPGPTCECLCSVNVYLCVRA